MSLTEEQRMRKNELIRQKLLEVWKDPDYRKAHNKRVAEYRGKYHKKHIFCSPYGVCIDIEL